jgi:hypothetical protein
MTLKGEIAPYPLDVTKESLAESLKLFLPDVSTPYNPQKDDYYRDPFIIDIKESKHEPIYNAHSYHTKVPPRGIVPYLLHFTEPGDLILDPFCGSGMTGIAVQMTTSPPLDILEQFPQFQSRTGPRHVLLNDLSPAASHIAYNYNTACDIPAFHAAFAEIAEAVSEEFSWLYGTCHYEPATGLYDPALPNVACRLINPPTTEPATLMEGHERTWRLISRDEVECQLGFPVSDLKPSGHSAASDFSEVPFWIEIPATIQYTVWSDVYRCEGFAVLEEQTGRVSTRGANVGKPIVQKKKVSRGCGREIVLWTCAMDIDTGEVSETFACPHCGAPWIKRQLALTASIPVQSMIVFRGFIQNKREVVMDRVSISRRTTKAELARLDEIQSKPVPYWHPTDKLPMGRQTRKTMSGKGFFTVDQYYTKRNLWAFASLWEHALKIPDPTTSAHLLFALTGIADGVSRRCRYLPKASFPMPVMSGTLYVPSFQKEFNVLAAVGSKINVRIPKLEATLQRDSRCRVFVNIGTATELPIPDQSVDFIFTDPPFGEALQYAELNFIWESWLRRFSRLQDDCVINYVHDKDLAFYTKSMRAAFEEMFRVLKPGRWASIVFKNTDDRVWDAIKTAAHGSGFEVVTAQEMDKQQRTFNQVNRAGAAGTDIVMNLHKPSSTPAATSNGHVGGVVDGIWDIISEYLGELPAKAKQDAGTYSDVSRSTPVLHSVVVKTRLSRGQSVSGVTPEAVEAACARYLRKVDGRWYFHGEVVNTSEKDLIDAPVHITDEATAIAWLQQELQRRPMTEGEMNTLWKMATLRVTLDRKLEELLSENFWRDADTRRWREPTDEERQKMSDDRSIRVLHDAERYVAGSLHRTTTDVERCDWIEVLFKASRQVEDREMQSVPALRGFNAGEGYRLITRLFQSVLREKVAGDVYSRAQKQAGVASNRIAQSVRDDDEELRKTEGLKSKNLSLFDEVE